MAVPPVQKLVLLALADHACEFCGLCWPGMKSLAIKTGLGETAITNAVKALSSGGLVKIHRYPQGGRGRATEYVVLPQAMKLSTAPCGKCGLRMTFPPSRGGYDNSGTDKGAATRPVSGETPRGASENPPPGEEKPPARRPPTVI